MLEFLKILRPFCTAIIQWAGIAIAAILLLFKVRQDGKNAVKNESLAVTLKGVKARDRIENNNLIASDDKLDKLRKKWERN